MPEFYFKHAERLIVITEKIFKALKDEKVISMWSNPVMVMVQILDLN